MTKQNEIAARILKEIRERLKFLNDVGLDYLTLSRTSGTLSGGESQRIRLASQIGSGLTGVLYVLDEPSIGLHQRDNARLLETLKHLRDIGNTVIVVEHDEDAIRTADYVVDIGPGAGVHGGEIIAKARPKRSWPIRLDHRQVPLRRMRSGARQAPQPERKRTQGRRRARQQPQERLGGHTARRLHLRHRRVGRRQVHLADRDALQGRRAQADGRAREPGRMTGSTASKHIDKVIDIDQSPIGRTPRSNPATYTGAFTPIRDWFAGLPEAKARGYKPGRFSFNVKGGRCEACQGDGVIKIEMHFLPDVYVTCDVCHGKRYNRETLDVTFKGKSIADVLDMTVEEGASSSRRARVRDKLANAGARRPGLHQGRPAGHDAVRRRGAAGQAGQGAVQARATGRTLYILDEPTTGLHFHDVAKLLEVLHELVEQGNTVVVIEHNLEVIKTADWIIDLGPEGGDGGGEIVAEGTSGCWHSPDHPMKPGIERRRSCQTQKTTCPRHGHPACLMTFARRWTG
jgi:excinuclease ABC subunit A